MREKHLINLFCLQLILNRSGKKLTFTSSFVHQVLYPFLPCRSTTILIYDQDNINITKSILISKDKFTFKVIFLYYYFDSDENKNVGKNRSVFKYFKDKHQHSMKFHNIWTHNEHHVNFALQKVMKLFLWMISIPLKKVLLVSSLASRNIVLNSMKQLPL